MVAPCRALVVLLGLLLSLSARAEEESRAASLSWVRLHGAEACSDAGALARAVDEKLGRSVFKGPSEALLLIEGRVERIEDGYRAKLELRDTAGQVLGSREILSAKADCVELSEAVALVLAVMVDPEGAMATRPVVTKAEATAPKPEAPPKARRAPPASTPLPAAPAILPEGSISAFARLSLGQMPRPAFGFGVGFELGVSGFGGLRLEAAGFLDQTKALASAADAGARFRLLLGGAALCPLWIDAGRTRLTMCTGGQVGVLQARAFGLDTASRDVSEWVLSGEVALRFSWRVVGPIALHLGAALVVPISRPLFEARTLDGRSRTLFEPAPVGGGFDAGLGGHF